MFLNNKLYNILKWVGQVVLPGTAVLYSAISVIWGFPYTEEIVGTILAVDVFVGAILGISNMQYQAKLQKAEKLVQPSFDMSENPTSFMSKEIYELLKWSVLILLPAGGTLYFALSKLWGFPYGQEVVGTIMALTTFMGVMLGVSTAKMNR